MVIENYDKIDWLSFKEKFAVVKVLNDEECDKIISSVEVNIDKLRVSNENGGLYLSAYEMQIEDLSIEVQEIIKKIITNFNNLVLGQSFIIKYSKNLIPKMPRHYDGSYLSLPINLNNNFSGGGTHLPFLKYKHIPQKYPRGCGLIFKADTIKSWHEALPVTEGDRYVLVLKFNKKTSPFIILLNILKLVIVAKFIELFNKKTLD
jgi:hypothetical protein